VKWFLSALIDLLYPPICISCENRMAEEEVICESCLSELEPTNMGNWVTNVTNHEFLDCTYSGWYFDDIFQQMIHEMKYQESRMVAQIFGHNLGIVLKEELSGLCIDAVIPVPLHSARLRERGFNQSALLGRAISDEIEVVCSEDILFRKRNTVSQTKLSAEERKQNMSSAFFAKDIGDYNRFLLIDDILTTGSTLSACAEALKSNGADFVGAVTAGTPLPSNASIKEIQNVEA
jgi:ComF family protein